MDSSREHGERGPAVDSGDADERYAARQALFDGVRERLNGARPEPEPVDVLHWRERPHGRVATADLERLADEADERARQLDASTKPMYEQNRSEMATIRARAALKRSAATFQRGRLLEDADALRQCLQDRTDQIGAIRDEMTRLHGQAHELREAAAGAVQKVTRAAVYPAQAPSTWSSCARTCPPGATPTATRP
ncbi:hypothetical protein ACFTZI_00975 [Streptomyces decoyicus]|uniref:hypothetical protein n=1 Tax=Streptomyces decoyicus TaxID=249567 RepID=UPI00362EEFB4